MKEIPKVLFICVANAGKSQMAEAIARAKYATQFTALSAGTNPKTTTNALAAKSVAEIGASIDGASPKPIDPTILRTAERVVFIGDDAPAQGIAGDRCPPRGQQVQSWGGHAHHGRGSKDDHREATAENLPWRVVVFALERPRERTKAD